MDDLKEAYDEDRLKGFICISDMDYKKGEEVEGSVSTISNYWFGKSSLLCLGLAARMQRIINNYIENG